MSIEAMKQALDALENVGFRVGMDDHDDACQVAHATASLRQAIEQAENPVAILAVFGSGRYLQLKGCLLNTLSDGDHYLYAAPQPTQQPLTVEHRQEMWRDTNFRGNGGQQDWYFEGIRAAEAAHNIKATGDST